MRRIAFVLCCLLGFAPVLALADGAQSADAVPLEFALVLDNSGSMRTNDPQHLLHQTVTAFTGRLKDTDRLAILSFDQAVHVLVPLAPVDRDAVTAALRQIDYRGLLTDIPGALEAARYELDTKGRPDALRIVIFMTDGAIDLGSALKNRDRKEWLLQSVVPALKDQGIHVFAIAISPAADIELLQSMTSMTGGSYYRVNSGAELPDTFTAIAGRLQQIRRQESDAKREHEEQRRATERSAATAPAPTLVPGQPIAAAPTPTLSAPTSLELPTPATSAPQQHAGAWPYVVAAIFLGIGCVLLVWRQRKAAIVLPAARLADLGLHSGVSEHILGKPITRLGSLRELNDVVIEARGVSREHATVEYRAGLFYLRDLRSTNGTFLNDERLLSEDTTGRQLKHGDLFRLGPYSLKFIIDAMQQAENAGEKGAGQTARLSELPQNLPPLDPNSPADAEPATASPDVVPGITLAKQPAAAPVAPHPGAGCRIHSGRPAVASCSRCGEPICELDAPTSDPDGGVACSEVIGRGRCRRAQPVRAAGARQ